MYKTYTIMSHILVVYIRGYHKAAREPHTVRERHWCGWSKFPIKNNIQAVYMHTRLTMKGVLKCSVKKGAP
jgi:hypothetical protein